MLAFSGSARAQKTADQKPGDTATASSESTFQKAREAGRKRSSFLKQTKPRAEETPKPQLEEFAKTIQPILKRTCVQCHGKETQEGNVRIDTLDPNLSHGNDIDWWLEVQAVLSNGEMPPPDEVKLSDADRTKLIDWLSNEIQIASVVRRASGEHSSFRRMTRYEFNYALQDLLGLPYDFAKDLPPEANSEDGFQNSSEVLHMSVSQLETYRRLARKALQRATVHGEKPPVLHWGVTMQDVARLNWQKQNEELEKLKAENADDPEKQKQKLKDFEDRSSKPHSAPYFRNLATGRTVRANWQYYSARYAIEPSDGPVEVPDSIDQIAVLPRATSPNFTIELGNQIPDNGIMRVRVLACREDANDASIPTLQLFFGWRASNEGRAVMPVVNSERPITAAAGQPEFYEWNVPLGEIYPRNSVRKTSKMGALPSPSEYIRLLNSSVSQGPIRIEYVEISTPVYSQWPPASYKQVFPESDKRSNETAYAREVIASFMQRAWRRPIDDKEVDRKLSLFETMRPACENFEEAIIEVLTTVLASPDFLYVVRYGGDEQASTKSADEMLAGPELAARLSLFLWCSLPDETLRNLGLNEKLADPDVLRQQIDRMLSDKRSERLSEHFVRQWLDMQLLDFLTVPRPLEVLKPSMQREPIALFHEVLQTDASVMDFLHCDYTMLDERLARHYGLGNVKGNHFRRVELPEDKRRGGLLTQAGLLAMNSAGEDSHPLKRGVWLLESILNDPPPPPPPAVPEIDLADPEIAKMTLKEQIEDHRNHPACMSCHAKIDPWGIAFENYDAQGRWRNQVKGKPVDSTSLLFNKQRLDGMDGLKRFLLENRQDQFVRAMVYKLTTYALGRPLTFADRASVDEITARVRKQGDGLATMIKEIAVSDLFKKK